MVLKSHQISLLIKNLQLNNYKTVIYDDQIYAEHQSGKMTVIWDFEHGVTATMLIEPAVPHPDDPCQSTSPKMTTPLRNYGPLHFEDGIMRLADAGFLNKITTND